MNKVFFKAFTRNTNFCNIRDVIIATFDQINAAVLNEKYCFFYL